MKSNLLPVAKEGFSYIGCTLVALVVFVILELEFLFSIEELDNNEYAYKLKINSNYLNVSLLRAPQNSILKQIDMKHGASRSHTLIDYFS